MAKKEGIPKHISKYKKLAKKAKQMLNTMDRHHRGAYDKAVDDIITKNGQVDMDLLDDIKNQEKFADKMADHYLSKAQKVLKSSGKLDDLEKELLMNAYAGTTKTQLKQLVRQRGKNFTFDHFYGELKPQLMETIRNNLTSATIGHFNNKHIDDIVRYTGSSKFVDSSKMRLKEALGVLQQYEELGIVPEKHHKKEIYYKKKKKK